LEPAALSGGGTLRRSVLYGFAGSAHPFTSGPAGSLARASKTIVFIGDE
jgi:hypothetical protein